MTVVLRVLVLTWEYPPVSVGGLGNHVYQLTRAMDKEVSVHIVTLGGENTPPSEERNNVTVHRVTEYPVSTPDFSTWVMQLNMALAEKALELVKQYRFDLVHAHDWLVAYAGRMLKTVGNLPLIATIHATEAGRNQGLHTPQQHFINSVEWWLTYEAWRVIVCSNHMYQEVINQFQLPVDKVRVIPNGVDPEEFRVGDKQIQKPEHPIIFFVGRLVREKGAQVLISAMPEILKEVPGARLVIAGKGPMKEELISLAGKLGIADKVEFSGYIDDSTRNRIYHQASVAVFPSLYEPFGIVALEGMATNTPVVVSDTGGLGEIVTHGVNGLKALPGNPHSLAANIVMLLKNKKLAASITENAARLITKKYNWRTIAGDTVNVYGEVLVEREQVQAATVSREVKEKTPICKPDGYQLRNSLVGERLDLRREGALLCRE